MPDEMNTRLILAEWEIEALIQTKSLYISAGHSHSDPGAVGNGHTEADIVLEFRDLVADELRDKVAFAKDGERLTASAHHPAPFAALHHAASPAPAGPGEA